MANRLRCGATNIDLVRSGARIKYNIGWDGIRGHIFLPLMQVHNFRSRTGKFVNMADQGTRMTCLRPQSNRVTSMTLNDIQKSSQQYSVCICYKNFIYKMLLYRVSV